MAAARSIDESSLNCPIYGIDGARVAQVNTGDAFEPFDLEHWSFSVHFALRTERPADTTPDEG